tara:strand:- start:209 stop:580 length:372 start_codon:yes stop_codon:yes gene_type:complete
MLFNINTSLIEPKKVLKHFITGGGAIALLSTMIDSFENNLLVSILYAGFPFTGFYLVWVAHNSGGAANAYNLIYHFLWTSIFITCVFYLILLLSIQNTTLETSMFLSTILTAITCILYYKLHI